MEVSLQGNVFIDDGISSGADVEVKGVSSRHLKPMLENLTFLHYDTEAK
jgi:hypothetical protein